MKNCTEFIHQCFNNFYAIIQIKENNILDHRHLAPVLIIFFQISNHLKNVYSNTVKMAVKMDRTARSADSTTTSYLRSALNLA